MSDVLSGEIAPGAALPNERRLAEVLGVSRPAVREALTRLNAAGLVEIRHGDATTVRDYRHHAGLDLLPRLLVRGGELDVEVVRSILEARLHNGPKVAELAAERRDPQASAAIHAAVEAVHAEQDPVAHQRAALTFWDHVVDAADSIVFRLMFNTLRATYEPALKALAAVMAVEVGRIDRYQQVAQEIEAGNAAGARRAAITLLEPATHDLLTALNGLAEQR